MNLNKILTEYDSMFHMYEKIWDYYKKRGLHNLSHKRSARYEILLDFIKEENLEKVEEYRELLVVDYYLRENAKTRPDFAGENKIGKEEARYFYEKEAEVHKYLPEYQQYDKNQMRKMTHLECFETLNQTILFDYKSRNPLNQEARTCVIDAEDYLRPEV